MRSTLVHALFGFVALAGATASAQTAPSKASPVERPIAGDMGMSFAFQGLAPMSVGGVQSFTVGRALMAEVGIRYMLADKWALPFSFGAGLLNLSPNGGGDASTDLGLSFTVGFQRYFRTWRRIAPYFGAKLSMSYVDPSGEKNYFVRIGIGPALGIEYFIADRVSLSMEYNVFLSFQIEGDNASRAAGALGGTVVAFNTSLWMGGQMALTFYF